MSYILDALERSEQERKQSEQPSFRKDQSLLFMKQEKRSVWPIVLVIALLLNLIVVLYLHLDEDKSVQRDKVVATHAEQTNFMDRPIDISEQVRQPSSTPLLALSDAISVSSPDKASLSLENQQNPLVSKQVDSAPKLVSNSEAVQAREEDELPSPVTQSPTTQSPVTQPLAPPLDSAPQIAAVETKKDLVIGNNVVVSGVPLIEGDQQAPFVEAQSDLRVKPKEDPYKQLAYLYELEGAARPNVPKLVFNSHIYSSTPSARRVMINNIYLREGQAFEGMIVVAIAETFVVFEKSGTQFKLPAMRDWLG